MTAFKVTKENQIIRLIFDLEGEKINKLSAPVLTELENVLNDLAKETSTKLLIIESAKPNIFIAGADIEEIKNLREIKDAEEKVRRGQEVLGKIEKLPFPSLAVINGACMGGGTELILCCTYRAAIDQPKTQIGLPEVNLGIFPGFGGTQRLPKLIGLVEALKIITAGKSVDAKKAEKIGLVDTAIPEGYKDDELPQLINKILAGKVVRSDRRTFFEKIPFTDKYIYKKTREQILKNTKGHYPAPIKAVEVIEKTYGGGLEAGLRFEREEFAKLAVTDVSKNLIQVFFTSEALKKDSGTPIKIEPYEIKNAAILGAGIMGGGIAWAFTKINIPVRMRDITWDAIGLGVKHVAKIYNDLKKIGKARDQEIDNKLNKLSGTLDYSGFEQADIVVEAIVENVEVKHKALAETETHLKPTAILASNTSSLSITKLAEPLTRPENFVGMHFFNPVNRMPLVEVIPGAKTGDKAVATVFALAKKMGKTPIKVGDCAGFLVNRILLPYMNEAVLMLEEGVSIERVDKLIYNFGLPMGPFTLADEVGNDVCYKVAKILKDAYGERVKLSTLLQQVYEKRLLGKKTGKGFYVYNDKKKSVNSEIAGAGNNNLPDQEIIDRCILLMVNEAAMCLEENIIEKPEYLDMAMILGTGFPAWRGGLCGYVDAEGAADVVARLKALEAKHGARFKPAGLLVEMGESGGEFYKNS